MNHDRAIDLLPAYADGQVNAFRRFLLGRHYNRCPSCLARLEALQAMRTALRTNLTVHRAPPSLASRIASALPREAAPPVRTRQFSGWGFGGSALAGALAGVALMLVIARPSDPLVGEVVADHVRSLMGDHLMDVPTSDQHTVKPWLSSRLELSPNVKDLKQEGFPLVGGRLDYVAGHRAAAMVYKRGNHIINLFAYATEGPDEAPTRLRSKDGFNVVRWRTEGLTYVAVSDLEEPQLMEFARLASATG